MADALVPGLAKGARPRRIRSQPGDGRAERFRARLGDESGDAVFDELQRAAGIEGRHHRFAREERFQRHVAVILVERREHHTERVRVKLDELLRADAAGEGNAIGHARGSGRLLQRPAQRTFADAHQPDPAVRRSQRPDDQIDALVCLEPADRQHVIAAGAGCELAGKRRRMMQRPRADAIEPRQPRRGGAAVREQARRFGQDFVVEGDEPVAETDVGFAVREFAVRRADQVVDGAVLVKEPRHLVRMADEVGGELGRNHRVDPLAIGLGEIHEPPGGRLCEELLLRIPLEGNRGRLRVVPLAPQFVHETLDVQLGAAAHEWDLCFADKNPALHLALSVSSL